MCIDFISDIKHLIIQGMSVDADIFELHIAYILQHRMPLHASEINISQGEILNWRILEALQVKSILRIHAAALHRLQVLDDDIGKMRQERSVMPLLVEEICMYSCQSRLVYPAAPYVDIHELAAPLRIRLETDRIIEVRTVKRIVLSEYIAYTAGNLTADRDAAMSIREAVAPDQDILRGNSDAPAILVASGLYGDAVITGEEVAVLDADIF